MRFEGPIVSQNQYLFASDWQAGTGEDISHLLAEPIVKHGMGFPAQVIGTEAAVAEWKASHDRKKLEKRAERTEKYADSCVDLALYYAAEAQVAILEAAAARQDANNA
jgi:hypothetical protein